MPPVDWSELLEKGGLAFVVIVALAWVVLHLWRRLNVVQDARIADQKEHTAQIIETNRLVDAAVRAMEARRD
ncbi:hypothetical protein [Pseudooceanicola atlanticus]|uniref:hypothetical protein n=1 Tax=Pseudooceanicola atlanticus TaxID=1461694 RepID=UPI0023554969|nr:hypothetical protein [Pseudooceanicola atlanticus]